MAVLPRPGPAFGDDPVQSQLGACTLFSALPETAVRGLAGAARRRRYEAGEALFRAGDPSQSAFVLTAGHARARVRSTDGRELVSTTPDPARRPGIST